MPNRIEARSAKAALTNATGRLPLLRLFSTPLIDPVVSAIAGLRRLTAVSNKAVVLGSRDATLITSFAVSAYGCSPCSGINPGGGAGIVISSLVTTPSDDNGL